MSSILKSSNIIISLIAISKEEIIIKLCEYSESFYWLKDERGLFYKWNIGDWKDWGNWSFSLLCKALFPREGKSCENFSASNRRKIFVVLFCDLHCILGQCEVCCEFESFLPWGMSDNIFSTDILKRRFTWIIVLNFVGWEGIRSIGC